MCQSKHRFTEQNEELELGSSSIPVLIGAPAT